MRTVDITSTHLLIDTKIKGSTYTADYYLFSRSGLEPEPDPVIRIEPGSVWESEDGTGGGVVTGAGDPMPGIGGVITGGVTGCGVAGFADAATLGVGIFDFVDL